MYTRSILVSLISSLFILSSSASPLLPRDGKPVNDAGCSGRGIGLKQADYLTLINQIDIKKDYDIPWKSDSLSSGRTTLNNGDVSMNVEMEDSSGSGTSDKGTITGLTLQYKLGLLNNLVNDNQPSCYSADGRYTYWLGRSFSEG